MPCLERLFRVLKRRRVYRVVVVYVVVAFVIWQAASVSQDGTGEVALK